MIKLGLVLVTAGAATQAIGCGHDDTTAIACAEFTAVSEDEGFVLDEGRMTLHAGQEGIFCNPMRYPARDDEKQIYMVGVSGIVSGGTRHFIMAHSDDPYGTPPACSDTGSGQVFEGTGSFQDYAVDPSFMSAFQAISQIAFGGGEGVYDFKFPDGYGQSLPLGYFESNHHVKNSMDHSIEVCAKLNVLVATADTVRFPLATFTANALGLSIPPHADQTIERTILAPFDMDIVMLMSHAHNFLTKFEMFAYRNGVTAAERLYVSSHWNSPLISVLDPPLRIKKGDGITYRCTYNNVTDKSLMFGIGATGEMCMPYGLYAYPEPLPQTQPPDLSAVSSTSTPVTLKML